MAKIEKYVLYGWDAVYDNNLKRKFIAYSICKWWCAIEIKVISIMSMMFFMLVSFQNRIIYIKNMEEELTNNKEKEVFWAKDITYRRFTYWRETYSFMMEEGKKREISIDEITQYLMNKGASSITATLVIGIMLGNLCTGTISDRIEELIQKLQ